MQIVVEMSEEKYKWIKENNPKADKNSIVGAIVYGTSLPKGHGRILDVDKLMDELIRKRVIDDGYVEKWIQEYIDNDAEIIIEADKESECT